MIRLKSLLSESPYRRAKGKMDNPLYRDEPFGKTANIDTETADILNSLADELNNEPDVKVIAHTNQDGRITKMSVVVNSIEFRAQGSTGNYSFTSNDGTNITEIDSVEEFENAIRNSINK
jgi:hypothetical protein